MASPAYTEILESALESSRTNAYVDAVVRQVLSGTTEDMLPSMAVVKSSSSPTPSPPPSPNSLPNRTELLRDLGDYLTRHAIVLSHFTDKLIQGPHIDNLTREMHKRSFDETVLSDYLAIATEDVHFSRLRKIRDLTAQFSRDVQAVWHPESIVPEPLPLSQTIPSPGSDSKSFPPSRSLSFSGEVDTKALRSRKSLHDSDPHEDTSPHGNASESDESDDDDDDEQFQQIDMNALRQRGKGAYYCPKGRHCDKGGVDKEGNLVRFDRNSSFM
ncbi:hypothetical protein HJFPF1_08892 [Paramyrothecium foliicola]|nr:hypothetical protein HJFPF1_08892 [Paramyrothecium foliicola]